MKKKSLILPLIPALIFSVSSCRPATDNSKIVIDFGRVVLEQASTVKEITYKTLKEKMIEREESFIICIANTTCGCWGSLEPLVAKLNFNKQLNICFVDNLQSGFLDDDFGLNTSETSIAFFRNGKLARQVIFKSETWDIFNKYEDLEKLVLNNAVLPHIRFISKENLDSYISQNKEFNLYIGRSECGDCRSINSTLLKEWNKTTTFEGSLYYFDIEEYRGTSDYQNIKDGYGLSQTEVNPILGYTYGEEPNITAGVVPTFQHRKGSTIEDMISILNDAASTADKKISRSYFTAERVAAMPFLKGTGNQFVLQDKALTEEEATNWRKSEQLKQHTPIFNKFFETYLK